MRSVTHRHNAVHNAVDLPSRYDTSDHALTKNTGDFWDVGNFYRCRLQIRRNFGSVILANLPTRVPARLLNNAKSPVGMTDLKSNAILNLGHWYFLPLPTSNSGEFVW